MNLLSRPLPFAQECGRQSQDVRNRFILMAALRTSTASVPNSTHTVASYRGVRRSRSIQCPANALASLAATDAISARSSLSRANCSAAAVEGGKCDDDSPQESATAVARASEIDGLILGIETSCDDTCAAVVSMDGRILGEAIASQGVVHAQWGGVVPSLARGEHEKAIDVVVSSALHQAGVSESDLTAVAFTLGPGLSLCLRVGAMKARQISAVYQLPLLPIHHMEAHALVARMQDKGLKFPFLTLLISGGHNLLLLTHSVGHYTQLGTTLDDAIGEAFDKTARMLGLDLTRGGGPAVEALAATATGGTKRFQLAVPMRGTKNCDFSFAGLKSNVARLVDKECPTAKDVPFHAASEEDRAVRADIAAAFQEVAVLHLEEKVRRAAVIAREAEPSLECLVVAGGVASNQLIRSRLDLLCQQSGLRLVCPPPRLCTDNGVMVAWSGVERWKLGLAEPPLECEDEEDARIELRPRWPLADTSSSSPSSPSSPSHRSAKKTGVAPPLSPPMPQRTLTSPL